MISQREEFCEVKDRLAEITQSEEKKKKERNDKIYRICGTQLREQCMQDRSLSKYKKEGRNMDLKLPRPQIRPIKRSIHLQTIKNQSQSDSSYKRILTRLFSRNLIGKEREEKKNCQQQKILNLQKLHFKKRERD